MPEHLSPLPAPSGKHATCVADVSRARRALVTAAREDLGAAMTLAVPFVLANPDEASVLRELSVIAGPSDVFRARVGELLRAATQVEREVSVVRVPSPSRPTWR